jgi:broad specificity phosphatase PhoE
MGNLVLVRHSITEASASGRNLGRRDDPPLTRDGVRLANRLGRAIAAELSELAHDEVRLVSSPAQRCRQTAAAIARRLGADPPGIEVADQLIEIDYGDWEGLSPDECRRRDPEVRAAWERDPFTTRCPGGESGSDVAGRIATVLDPLEEWLTADHARIAVVVAHNHVNRIRLCALFGWPMRQYRDRIAQQPGGYSIVGLGAGRPVVRRLNAAPG